MKIANLSRVLSLALGCLFPVAHAQDGSEIYNTRCAACHEMPVTNVDRPPPSRAQLASMPPNNIYKAVSEGAMRLQGAGLTNTQMQSVAEYLTGQSVSLINLEITENLCASNPPMKNPALSPGWNDWG